MEIKWNKWNKYSIFNIQTLPESNPLMKCLGQKVRLFFVWNCRTYERCSKIEIRLQIYFNPIMSGHYANICETHVCNIMYICMYYLTVVQACLIASFPYVNRLLNWIHNQIEYLLLPVSLTLKKVEIVHIIWFFFHFS